MIIGQCAEPKANVEDTIVLNVVKAYPRMDPCSNLSTRNIFKADKTRNSIGQIRVRHLLTLAFLVKLIQSQNGHPIGITEKVIIN